MPQTEQVYREHSAEAHQYWLEALLARAAEPFVIRENPPVVPGGGVSRDALPLVLPAAAAEALERVTAGSPFLLFVALLTAVKIALYKYTRSEVVTVGCPPLRGGNGSVHAPRALPIVDRMDGNLSFRDTLLKIRQTVLQAYKHQDYPIDDLGQDLGLAPGDPCKVRVMTLLDGLQEQIFEPGASMSLIFEKAGSEIRGTLKFDPLLVSAKTAGRMGNEVLQVLDRGLRDAGTRVDDLCALTPAERRQLLVEWNNTEREYPSGCAHELIERQAASRPDAIAVVYGDSQLTYLDLNRRAAGLAATLRRLGVGPETLVGLHAERSLEMIVGLLAILKAGGAYAPMDPSYPAERLRYMLEDTRLRVILTEAARSKELPPSAASIVILDGEPDSEALGASEVLPGNLAYVIYTSGSSGMPKGACVTHEAICNLAAAQVSAFGISAGDAVLQFASFSFDAAVSEWATTLSAGARLVLAPRDILLAGAGLAQVLQEHQIAVVTLPPSALAVLPRGPFPALRTLVVAGEACTPDLVNGWSKERCLLNAYGPTEATVCATISGPLQNGATDMGGPIANTLVYVTDSHGLPVPVEVPGELHIGGTGLARGYLNQPGLTAEKFVPDPFSGRPGARMYRTGDRVRWLEAGRLEFLGRLDNQVKIRGYRIETGEIEAMLSLHQEVRQCVVLAREDQPGQQRLVAYVAPERSPAPSATELREHLLRSLPEHMVPAAFVFLAELPLTPNGKVNRGKLPVPGREAPDVAAVRPRDSIETHLKQLWEDVLGAQNVGIRDDFFVLGGHSLAAVTLTARLTRLYGAKIPVRTLFERPTIERMAEFLRQEVAVSPPSSVVPVQPRGDRPPFFCVHPGGGLVHCFVDLASHLGVGQPFYALQSRGFEAGQEPLGTIEEMAAVYAAEIRAVQPRGPYHLGGLSMGAAVAYEMARQLLAQCETVSLLALLDGSFNPDPPAPSAKPREEELLGWEREYLLNKAREEAGIPEEEMRQLDFDGAAARYLAAAQSAGKVPQDITVPQFRRFLRVYSTNVRALQFYRPQPYAGRVILFRASDGDGDERDNSPGWAGLAAGGVESYNFSGPHGAFIYEPGVRAFAERLRACIDAAGIHDR